MTFLQVRPNKSVSLDKVWGAGQRRDWFPQMQIGEAKWNAISKVYI